MNVEACGGRGTEGCVGGGAPCPPLRQSNGLDDLEDGRPAYYEDEESQEPGADGVLLILLLETRKPNCIKIKTNNRQF